MDEVNQTLVEHFSKINDPRILRAKRHKLIDIIVIGIIGTLCGANSWETIEQVAVAKKEWLSKFLDLPNGIPSHDTISRLFSRISPSEFERNFIAWMKSTVELTKNEIIAIDGKVLRRSFDSSKGRPAIHMVSAWAVTNGVVMGQVKVDDKSNEITAIPKLLSLLDISGCIITIDAMGCQKEIAKEIISNNGDYVLGLKGNQSSSLGAVEMCFDNTSTENILSIETTDADHGRLETREYKVISADLIPELNNWDGCKSAIMVKSKREIKGKETNEERYYISSLSPDPLLAARAVRSHWGIENSLHWVLDMTFNEDRSRVRKEHAPENLSVVRHISINLLKKEKTLKGSLVKKKLQCCLSNEYLGKALFGSS